VDGRRCIHLPPRWRWLVQDNVKASGHSLRHNICSFATCPFCNTTSRTPIYYIELRRIAESQHVIIGDMIASKVPFKAQQIANVAGCNRRTIHRRSKRLPKASPYPVGRPRSVTPQMLDTLCEHLLENPGLYLEEMVLFVLDKFKLQVTTYSIARALKSIGWSKKTIRRIEKGRNADLRDLYVHNTSHFLSYQYVFVVESGCDKRIGYRRTGWAPLRSSVDRERAQYAEPGMVAGQPVK
jgi:transposase